MEGFRNIDLTGLESGYYYINLNVKYSGGEDKSKFVLFYVEKNLKEGMPKFIRFPTQCQKTLLEYYDYDISCLSSEDYMQYYTPIKAQPVVDDINTDGRKDSILALGDNIFLLDENGNSLSGWPISTEDFGGAGYIVNPPSVSDLDNDGKKEIVIVDLGKIFIFNSEGRLNKVFSLSGDGYKDFKSYPVISDLDNDGKKEIVIATSGNVRSIRGI